MSPELTPELALQISGFDPRYARVLAIATSGDVGGTLIDPNGDGSNSEFEHVVLDETGEWTSGGGSGGGTSDAVGPHGWGDYSPQDQPGARYAYGRADSPGPHTVTLRRPEGLPVTESKWWVARPLQVTASAQGWWVWIERTPPPAE